MYQAIARYVYLTEVRKKAMDLHADKKEFDQERAVILIQAVSCLYIVLFCLIQLLIFKRNQEMIGNFYV